jgi:hypothetical protein
MKRLPGALFDGATPLLGRSAAIGEVLMCSHQRVVEGGFVACCDNESVQKL